MKSPEMDLLLLTLAHDFAKKGRHLANYYVRQRQLDLISHEVKFPEGKTLEISIRYVSDEDIDPRSGGVIF